MSTDTTAAKTNTVITALNLAAGLNGAVLHCLCRGESFDDVSVFAELHSIQSVMAELLERAIDAAEDIEIAERERCREQEPQS